MTTYNLASLLENSAAEVPRARGHRLPGHRPADDLRRGRHRRQHGRQPAGEQGHPAGRQGGAQLPNLPYFSLVYWGILKAGAHRGPAQRAAQGSRGRLPPRRLGREGLLLLPGHRRAADRRGGVRRLPGGRRLRALLRRSPPPSTAESPFEGIQTFGQALGGTEPTFDSVETDEDDTAVILYTSGTTGQPKGAELRHRNMRDNALLGRVAVRGDPENPDTFLCVLPLFHSFGQTVIQNGAAAYGGTVVMLPRFEAGAGPAADAERGHHVLRRRADHVLGPARRAEGGRGLGRRREAIKDNLRVAVAGGVGAAGRGAQGLRGRSSA